MTILVTGGTGYIGTHTCLSLIEAGYEIIIVDNLSNSKRQALDRIEEISGTSLKFIQADIRDHSELRRIFRQNKIDAVIHFAGLKAVGESVVKPLLYYDNNVTGTISLCEVMNEFGVKTIIFSSSATVYGDPQSVPITEDFPLSATNPYGWSKLMIEEILRSLHIADEEWNVALLRYFNPIGAHISGLIGEDPNGIPNNLMPYISQVAIGKLSKLHIFGNDYPTRDGTGVRDYIHVVDLANGHVKALDYLMKHTKGSVVAVNLGTGRGYSVLEMVEAFQKASGLPIKYDIIDRRPGDIAECYADPSLAQTLFHWHAEFDVEKMCEDAWRWQMNNPNGY
jgi:UDP-glucose 4-epimerase